MRHPIGVLALQGDFSMHQEALERIGVNHVQIRKPEDLQAIDGLIIPGGESTTLIKLMNAYGFIEPLKAFYASGKAVFGTCAGSILLARRIEGSSQFSFGFIDVTVIRNGYGRQIQSFEAEISVKPWNEPVHGVFIRAPRITETGADVDVLARYDRDPVAARSDRVLVTTFHPELTGDTRLHEYFVNHLVIRK